MSVSYTFRVQTPGKKYMSVVTSASSEPSAKDKFTSLVFQYRRLLVASIVILGLYVLWRDIRIVSVNADNFYLQLGCAVAGTILILSGIGIRIWAGLYIGGHKNRELVTQGPYSLVRNPLYTGNLVSALGVMLMTQSPVAALLVLTGLSVIYVGTIAHEEKHLLKIFGETYADYLHSTPRLIPDRKALRVMLSGEGGTDRISYCNLDRELKRGGALLTTGILVLLGMSVLH